MITIGQAPVQPQVVSIQSQDIYLSAAPKVEMSQQHTMRAAVSRSRIGSDDNVHTLNKTPTMRRTISLKHSLDKLPTASRFSQLPPEPNTFLLNTLGAALAPV